MPALGLLTVNNGTNIGDEIQSVAVFQHTKGNDILYIDRDSMSDYCGRECVVVMNGWFSHRPDNFPPSSKIIPIFFGFHMTERAALHYEKYKSYFKKYEPIGCRDAWTMNVMRSWGVNSYVSGCATMTFPSREGGKEFNECIAVDVSRKIINKKEKSEIIFMSHEINTSCLSAKTRFDIASQMLEYYRNNAKLILTTRIHCAMPCFSMGIPTAYIGNMDKRTDIIKLIGIEANKTPKILRRSIRNMRFCQQENNDLKESIKEDLKNRMRDAGLLTK